ncbi:hypothetical protein PODOV006v2_p0028 [Vibrio phage 15E36.1]|uniref:Uncharacterized protein n=1 Tax=Vibrio phage 15E36.1 TaxID=2859290 RepID=A0AAE7XUB0_9CAUD|nr:hypothetical protein PODOV006v2_p0028 [Vibrio phage 15E36.1]
MSNAIVLSILPLTTVVAGKFKTSYAVVDQAGELIGSKAHATQAEAELELGSLKYFAEGMTFARATAKEGTPDKTLVGKANVVAAFLMYQEQLANPVAEAPAEEVEAPVETEAVAETADEEF